MAKTRVHELAKTYGIESKDVLDKLKEMGEFVKSASSTIELPVEMKFKKTYGDALLAEKATAAPAEAPAETPAPKAPAQAAAPAEAPAVSNDVSVAEPVAPAAETTSAPKPGPRAPAPAAEPEAPAAAVAEPEAPAAEESATPTPAPRPAARPGAPRPGNNPFASSQGMGRQPAPAPRESEEEDTRAPRPPAAGGRPGMPRPNPAMMNRSPGAFGTGPGGRGPAAPVARVVPALRPAVAPRRVAVPPLVAVLPAVVAPVGAPAGAGAPGRGGPGFGGGPGGGRGRPGQRGQTQGAFGRPGGPSRRGRKSKRARRQEFEQMEAPTIGGVRVRKGNGETVRLARGASLTDFAEKINVDAAALVQMLFSLGEMVTATESVNDETLELLGEELNYIVQVVSPEDEDRELLESFDLEFGEDEGDECDLVVRPPVVTVMGHVDHGKTKLLDALRSANVVDKEAGGITQHIGAYQVETEVEGNERSITFLDTPGHEAFTAMRARGSQSADIAVLVVAADDGVMPQTVEALNHARAADVPIVVAVNKIDKPDADPTKVRGQLSEYGLVPEEYGGDSMFVDVSAKSELNLDKLLEAIVLTADAALDLRANPEQDAQGLVVEAHLDRGRGPVATVLVQRGTLRVGDSIVAGPAHGRVRALLDERSDFMDEALPGSAGDGARPVGGAGCGSELPGRRGRPDGPSDRREARGA